MMPRDSRQTIRFTRLCPQCEYDLRGLPEPCVCPECGREIEVGLRSIRVWPLKGKPGWIKTIVIAGFSAFFLAASISSFRRDGLTVVTCWMGAVTVGVLAGAFNEARKLRLRLTSRTNGLLHFSPSGVGMIDRHKRKWVEWFEVRNIRLVRTAITREWMLRVEGQHLPFGYRTLLILATLPRSRRTAAHVRNTLRRHLRAWQQANAPARE